MSTSTTCLYQGTYNAPASSSRRSSQARINVSRISVLKACTREMFYKLFILLKNSSAMCKQSLKRSRKSFKRHVPVIKDTMHIYVRIALLYVFAGNVFYVKDKNIAGFNIEYILTLYVLLVSLVVEGI